MTKQELNLLQLAARGSTKPAAASTEIMRRELADADLGSELLDDVPDEFFRHPFAPNFASTTHAAEEAASGDSGGLRPLVKQTLHPIRNRNGSNVPSLPAKVHDCPMSFALLNGALYPRLWYGRELRSTPRWAGLMRKLNLPES